MAEESFTPQDDYSNAGGGADIEVIENDEQLEAFLESQENPSNNNPDDKDDKTKKPSDKKEGDDDGDDTGINIGADDDNDSPPADREYKSIVHYLDDQFKLGMNLDQLPNELDSKKEAEIVGSVFSRLQRGLANKLAEYDDVRKVLEDKEVKDFIAAKQSGKTMKDFAQQYATTTEEMSDEALIIDELKLSMPNATEDEIKDIVEGYKTANTLEKTASVMRKARVAREEAEATRKSEDEANKASKEAEDRQKEVDNYSTYVNSVKTVYGVPLTDDMRQQAFVASTQLDENGLTYLDKALQSDEGVLLATLGILHMEKLMKANGSVVKNRARKDIADSLFASKEELQSMESEEQTQKLSDDEAIAAINQL